MNIIITGCKGLLGSELSHLFCDNHNVFGIDLPEFDISDKKSIESFIINKKADIVINCAAMTNVDLCESKKNDAFKANSLGVNVLANLCEKYNVKLVHYSTDYIFDGNKGLYYINDIPNPINYYGASKLYGEFEIIKRKNLEWLIIRTNVLYGSMGEANFINWLNNSLVNNKKVNIIDDQFNNPCFIDDLVDFTEFVIDKNLWNNIFHAGSKDYMNRFDFALKFAQIMNYDKKLISSVKTKDFNQKATRPLKGGLDIKETEKLTGFKFNLTEDNFIKLKKTL
ncbi:MAG: SDR family oxidoreductase [Candidatus Muirbacterium halophilum]|nr:SDR family oxidoreductase [Candidatus Muirbacterium halophilum]